MTYNCAILRRMITQWKMLLGEDFLVLAVLAAVSGWHSPCSCLASATVSVLSFSCVNIALELETSEEEHWWAYYPDRIVAKKKKKSNIFLTYSSNMAASFLWH